MKLLKIVFLTGSLMFAGVTLAGEDATMKMKIVVDDSDADVHLSLNSDDLDFNLYDMQEGETQSIVDEEGRSILVTREAGGFKFDVDGKTIDMPLFNMDHDATWIDDGDAENVQVRVMRGAMGMAGHSADGVTIISAQPIDAATRDSIRSLLASSGQAGDIEFIDTGEKQAGLHKKVFVIKQK